MSFYFYLLRFMKYIIIFIFFFMLISCSNEHIYLEQENINSWGINFDVPNNETGKSFNSF